MRAESAISERHERDCRRRECIANLSHRIRTDDQILYQEQAREQFEQTSEMRIAGPIVRVSYR
jgi:hypothetical protein